MSTSTRPEWMDYDDEDYEQCSFCDGDGCVNCYCGGDLCVCENYGERVCPKCHGEGYARSHGEDESV